MLRPVMMLVLFSALAACASEEPPRPPPEPAKQVEAPQPPPPAPAKQPRRVSERESEIARTFDQAIVVLPGAGGGPSLVAKMHTPALQARLAAERGRRYPTVLYLHGCDGLAGLTPLRAMARRGFAVIAPDSYARRGNGASAVPTNSGPSNATRRPVVAAATTMSSTSARRSSATRSRGLINSPGSTRRSSSLSASPRAGSPPRSTGAAPSAPGWLPSGPAKARPWCAGWGRRRTSRCWPWSGPTIPGTRAAARAGGPATAVPSSAPGDPARTRSCCKKAPVTT